jgi:protein gp37
MGNHTKIQWCDSTVNPTTGCDGCELWSLIPELGRFGGSCYSGPYHENRMAKALPHLYAPDFTEVRLVPGRMAKAAAWSDLTGTDRPDKPWLNGMPRTIFVADMGDLFSKAVTFEYLREELIDVAMSEKGRRHIWMLLTKRPARMVEFARWLGERGVDWPNNVWAGTSVTGHASLKRVAKLLEHPAAVRYVSVEPLVEDIGFPMEFFGYGDTGSTKHHKRFSPIADRGIDLLIVGGESDQPGQRGRPFDIAWARKFIEVARETPLKVFVKQLGSSPIDSAIQRNWTNVTSEDTHYHGIPLKDGHGGDMAEWEPALRVRQMPPVGAEVGRG